MNYYFPWNTYQKNEWYEPELVDGRSVSRNVTHETVLQLSEDFERAIALLGQSYEKLETGHDQTEEVRDFLLQHESTRGVV